jgi:probable HAF family extracellular repeat protein
MRYFKRWQPAVVCLLALALLAVVPARRGRAQATSYTVTDLGTLGGAQSRAFGLNNCGRVVGDSWPSGSNSDHPFFWDGHFTDIEPLGGTAEALNWSGVAAGIASDASGALRAFIWSAASGKTDIGTLPGDSVSLASDINDAGQVAGLSENNNGGERAFVWNSAAGMQAVPDSGGISPIRADGINNAGSIVGVGVATASGGVHAYLLTGWPGGTITDLGTFTNAVGTKSFANKINDAGQVVGRSDLTAGGSFHAFVWSDANQNGISDAGEMKDLGALAGGSNSVAYDINASGQVVGFSEVTGGAEHAFVWHDDNGNGAPDPGEMKDLNSLTPGSGWTLQEARAINDGGQIVGFGLNPSGDTHAFLLTPSVSTGLPPSGFSSISASGKYNGTATLTATLATCGGPLSNKTVSFTLNGTPVCDINTCPKTDVNGVATLAGVSLSGINVGVYSNSVRASFAGDASNAASLITGPLTVSKGDQTITFAQPADKTFGDADFTVSATGGGSGNAVTFSAAGNCTVSAGSTASTGTVHITGAGSCTITASQAGNSNYNAAPDVSRSFAINPAASTTIVSVSSATYDGQPHGGTASVTGAGGLSQSLTVTYAGRNGTNYPASTTPPTNAGDYTASASFAGDANHAGSSDSKDFQIAKASTSTALSSSADPSGAGQSVTFTATVSSSAGTPTGSVQFKADGANLGSVTLSSGGVATLTTSSLTAGSHTITADYGGDSNFASSSGTLAGGQVVSTVFGFSQALYTVAERGGSITVTVKRTGDTSAAMSVDYATDDGSIPTVAVPCSSVTGLALERCDYTRAAGTLRFAAGEAEKAFTVLVNDDSYTEGAETVSLKLSNPAGGAVLGTQSSATLQITDDSPESTGNPVDEASFFVRQHYHDFLNREPDDAGLQFWTGGITSCGSDANCVAVKRVDTSAAFFLSIEFQDTGYLVERIYKTAFGDADGSSTFPGPHTLKVPVVRLQEFLRDTQEIGSTPTQVIVNQGNWQQQLEDNKNAFVREFVSRQAFRDAGLLSLTPAQYVDKLNQNAGGVLSQSERDQLVAQLTPPNSDTPAARASVLRQVAENPVLADNEKNRAFVLMQFFGYLRRNPNDAQDTDYTGYDFWLQKLDQFHGDFVQAEMVRAFITSTEYRQRFGQP